MNSAAFDFEKTNRRVIPHGGTTLRYTLVARAFTARGFYHQVRTAGHKGLRYGLEPGEVFPNWH